MASLRQDMVITGTDNWIRLDDFVVPKVGDASFRVESLKQTNYRMEGFSELVTVPSASTQQVLMWQHFARIATSLDEVTSVDTTQWTAKEEAVIQEARSFVSHTRMNQRVMDAVMKSIQDGGTVVPVQ